MNHFLYEFFVILAPFWSSKAAKKEPQWPWKVAQGRSPVAKTRFYAHEFGPDYIMFLEDQASMAPGRLPEGLVKVVHFWSQF